MTEFFQIILHIGFVSSYLILLMCIVRLLLIKIRKAHSYFIWLPIFATLVCPFDIYNPVKFMPSYVVRDMISFMESSAGTRIRILWLVGIGTLLLYKIAAARSRAKDLQVCILVQDNIYAAHMSCPPLVKGILNPRIYLPANLDENEVDYVILKEQIHLRRRDYVIKAGIFCICTMHWFNPLVWLAYYLAAKDMEKACDEKAMQEQGQLGVRQNEDYI